MAIMGRSVRWVDAGLRHDPGAWRQRSRQRSIVAIVVAALVGLSACSGEESGQPATPVADSSAPAEIEHTDPPAAESQADLVVRGRSVYMGNCIACHAPDPKVAGALGPDVAGSSRELLQARVLRAEYPPDYPPKADTKMMIPLPHLANDIDALAAFLDQ